jgi:hypothetical protein
MLTDDPLKQNLAEADPSKEFFIDMITKDISLVDCILDLIDNSIEAAVKDSLSRRNPEGKNQTVQTDYDLKGYYCKIHISPEKFQIKDNCGGISYDQAIHEIFHFGRKRSPDPNVPYPIGLYGIGMKRALFKIGKKINISSSVSETDGFNTAIDVPIWKEAQGWTIPIEKIGSNVHGTTIEVSDLMIGIKSDFSTTAFINELIRNIQQHYFIFLQEGITIEVNTDKKTNNKVDKIEIKLLASDDIKPAYYKRNEKIEKEGVEQDVEITIIAGMIDIPPRDTSADSDFSKSNMTGWFIVCNDRVVLAADTSEKTGWNVNYSKWHPQYNGFFGMVIFHSKDPSILPWTTTKKDIDMSNQLYISVKSIMRDLAKAYITYTGARRVDFDVAEKIENRASPTKIEKLDYSEKLILPARSTFKTVAKDKQKDIEIKYRKNKEQVNAIAEAFDIPLIGNYTEEVGSRTFDYYYKSVLNEE